MAFSLQTKLVGNNLVAVIVMGVVGAASMQVAFNRMESDTSRDVARAARSLQFNVAAQFFERYGDIQAFAINPSIQSPKRSDIVGTLNQYVALYGIYDLILVVDLKGHLVAVNDKGPDGKALTTNGLYQKNYSSDEWFKNVVAGKTTDDKERNFSGSYVSDATEDQYANEAYGASRYTNTFAAPIRDAGGQIIGVIANRAGFRWVEGEFQSVYKSLDVMGWKSAHLNLVDQTGNLLIDYAPGVQKDSLEVAHDYAVLGKFNVYEKAIVGTNELKQGKSGSLRGWGPIKQKNIFSGYSPIDDVKFARPLGWSVIVRVDEDEALALLQKLRMGFWSAFVICFLVVAGVATWFARSVAASLTRLAETLTRASGNLQKSSGEISEGSIKLSEATSEQAAALQETVSAIEQISAMVSKNADNAKSTQQIAMKSQDVVAQGRKNVEQMVSAIGSIAESNQQIAAQVAQSNNEISEIVKMISEIGEKTKVINDIVFQTKLLSFNASVEAARAGEHGKGFAVVAEEVGNLAQMSGTAAKDISSLLGNSIQKVQDIVKQTQSRVGSLIDSGKSRIEAGTQTANACAESFGQIQDQVDEMSQMVGGIATASSEQAQGVSEVNKAMNQLDQVTHQNSTFAGESASQATGIKQQSDQIQEMVGGLVALVRGSSTQVATAQLPIQESTSATVIPIRSVSHSPKAETLKKAVGDHTLPLRNDGRFSDV